ncbi:RagB/SusD family nutrient uptake outer membrane protein [Algoriphagus boritolerans]|uniref:Starch-binding associating with outer membrane n=1 Tax=Algoriphagus boritolerans DSM 17298 = JCM 18970 TaxID=1120964 RepID=A0A1H5SZQ5_9BACT|nr:RagB/SusD family nutrient uptake outer membrane protein [Algoriphagus boritolerans]SEF56009.1 Starch-binding associating with outer membrane [Algoriphagus boritolerans DSM 17298 = JCM 18970]
MLKSISKICLMLPLVYALGACQELEQEVLDGVTADDIANSNNPNLINVLKASAYSRIVGSWGGHNSIWSIYEISSDEMAIPQKGADWEDGGLWLRMHRHTWQPSDEAFNNSWNYCYTAVGEINNLLIQYPDVVALNAELKVLRALVYLWLIDSFGNVPIIEETSTGGNPTNNSRAEVFAFIESSIKENIDLLPKEDTKTTVNYYSAQAMLAKLYLNAEIYTGTAKWAEAEAAADEVINSGVYSLSSNFFTNFSERNNGSTENILTLPYDQNNAGGFNLPQMTLHYLSQNTYNLQEQPWNGYASLEEFYNNFDDDDVRKNSFLVGPQFASDGSRLNDISAEAGDPDGQPLTFTPEINMLAPNAFRQAGVRVGKFEFAMGAASSLNNDYPLIRLGDIILIKAEAAFRQGKTADALTAINQVRTRAGMPAYTSLTLDTIFEERGFEMFAEASRRTDMIRFGKWNQPWWEKGQSEPFRALFPIPQQAINANPSLVQNPGY